MAEEVTPDQLTQILEKLHDPDLRRNSNFVSPEGWIRLNIPVPDVIAELFPDWSESRIRYVIGLLKTFGYLMTRQGGVKYWTWYLFKDFALPVTPEMLNWLRRNGLRGLPRPPWPVDEVDRLRAENRRLRAENERLSEQKLRLKKRVQELEASGLKAYKQLGRVLNLPAAAADKGS